MRGGGGVFSPVNQGLTLDTSFFDEDFKQRLIASIDDLDARTDGVLINGDNFHALNLLQEKYRESIKCVFIDPPYNTEEDRSKGKFVYKDNYSHSSWLSMVRDRISLAKSLQTENGLFFSAIDDNELFNYKFLLDGIYGEQNFKANIIWHSRKSKQNDIDVSLSHNYLITYSQNKHKKEFYGQSLNEFEFDNPDNDPKGKWKPSPMDAPGIRERTSFFAITNPNTGKEFFPPSGRHWTVFEEDVPRLIKEGRIYFGKNGKTRPQWKRYWEEVKEDSQTVGTIWDDVGTATNATKELESILGHKPFETPKPSGLLEEVIQQSTLVNDTIIDYFAGSGTTGHAVINLNREDEGKRKYILVEMGAYFDTVTKPRIQKVIYAKDWKDGEPVRKDNAEPQGISHCFKTLRLESYEDALNNLKIQKTPDALEGVFDEDDDKKDAGKKNLSEKYLLSYMLDTEIKNTILNLTDDNQPKPFDKPFGYQLKITSGNETTTPTVDLVETFNYLIGLTVARMGAVQRFNARFKPDAEGRVKIDGALTENKNGAYVFRAIRGKIKDTPVLVIWRELTGNIEQDNVALEEYLRGQIIGDGKPDFDVIYVNGSNTLMNARIEGEHWEVQLIEKVFHGKMFAQAGHG